MGRKGRCKMETGEGEGTGWEREGERGIQITGQLAGWWIYGGGNVLKTNPFLHRFGM
jgi:hypothetical protein